MWMWVFVVSEGWDGDHSVGSLWSHPRTWESVPRTVSRRRWRILEEKFKKKKNYRWKNDQWFHLQWWLRFTFWFHLVSTLNGLTLSGLLMNNFSLSVSKNLSVSDPKSRIFQSFPVIILRVRSSESVVYLSRVYWTQSEGSRCVNDTEPAWGRSVWPVARTRLLSLITYLYFV